MASLKEIVETTGVVIDGAGVLVIAAGLLYVTALSVLARTGDPLREYRRQMGKVILLGLEFLVAGDIVRTVAVMPTLESVTVLGIIVVIRTFLSIALEVELNNRWPWEAPRS